MTNGSIHSASISAPHEVDTWTFTAAQNDAISLTIGEVLPNGPDPGFYPWIRLLNPNGVQIGSNFGVLAAQIDLKAPLGGTYTVLVASGDAAGTGQGAYRLTLAQAPGAFEVSAGDEGGPMTNGADHLGTIYVGDLDQWSFQANQNDLIALSVGEILPDGTGSRLLSVDPFDQPHRRHHRQRLQYAGRAGHRKCTAHGDLHRPHWIGRCRTGGDGTGTA